MMLDSHLFKLRTNLVIKVQLKAEQKCAESHLPEQFASIATMELELISFLSVANASFLIHRLMLSSEDRTVQSHSTSLFYAVTTWKNKTWMEL